MKCHLLPTFSLQHARDTSGFCPGSPVGPRSWYVFSSVCFPFSVPVPAQKETFTDSHVLPGGAGGMGRGLFPFSIFRGSSSELRGSLLALFSHYLLFSLPYTGPASVITSPSDLCLPLPLLRTLNYLGPARYSGESQSPESHL